MVHSLLLNDIVGSLGASGQWTSTMRSSSFHTLPRYPATPIQRRETTHHTLAFHNDCFSHSDLSSPPRVFLFIVLHGVCLSVC